MKRNNSAIKSFEGQSFLIRQTIIKFVEVCVICCWDFLVNFKLVVKKRKNMHNMLGEKMQNLKNKNLCICHPNFVFKQPFYKHNNLKLQTHVSKKLIMILITIITQPN